MSKSEIGDYWFYVIDFGPKYEPRRSKPPRSWYGLFQYIFMKNNRWESLSNSLVWKGINAHCKMMASHLSAYDINKQYSSRELAVDIYNMVFSYIANK